MKIMLNIFVGVGANIIIIEITLFELRRSICSLS